MKQNIIVAMFYALVSLCAYETVAAFSNHQKFNKKMIQSSKVDKKIGRRIYQVWRELKNNRNKTSELSLLKKELKKSTIFSHLTPLFNQHYKLVKTRSIKGFKKNCIEHSYDDYRTEFEKKYALEMSSYCRYKFLKIFNTQKKINKNFLLVSNYLSLSIAFFIKKKLQSPFSRFLKKATIKKSNQKIISNIFYDHYQSNKISPLLQHLSFLRMTPKFNTLIQSNNVKKKSNKGHFRRELRQQVQEIRRNLKKKKPIRLLIDNLIEYAHHNSSYIGKKYTKRKVLGLALDLKGHEYESVYLHLINLSLKLSTPKNKADVHFYVLLQSLVNDDYEKAMNLVRDYKFDKNFKTIKNSKLQYWIAKIFEKNGDINKAKEYYKYIINHHPLSFYSIISMKTLNRLDGAKVANLHLEKYTRDVIRFDFNISIYQKEFLNNLKRLHVWLDLSLEDFISTEYKDLLKHNKNKIYKKRTLASTFDNEENEKHIFYLLLNTFFDKSKHLYSFKFIYKKLYKESYPINSDLMAFLFPKEYWKSIKRRAKTIDPILVLSLIRQESAFNPQAKSPVGARGLMQIMLPTARQYGKRITYKHLHRPQFNIKIGVKYLKRLIRKFDNNLIFTLAAYNAGETVVRRWRRNIKFSNDPITAIEQIPYKETRNYVKLIYRNIFFYKMKENKNILNNPLQETFRISMK